MRTALVIFIMLLALPAAAGPLDELLAMDTGQATFHFTTRDDVWGDGRSISICDEAPDDVWRSWVQGPLHILFEFVDGELDEVEMRVGEAPSPHRGELRDFGELTPEAASRLLLDLARALDSSECESLILPAVLAEGVTSWPELLAMARDDDLNDDLRGQAIFWLGQDAGRAAAEGLEKILDDDNTELALKEQAIFALSQHEGAKAYDTLSRVVHDSPHPQLREEAIFWLAQSEDPRALELFESILLGR